jgi:hypothetical protein
VKASHTLDTIRTSFDEEHLVANAGLLLPATLMQRLGVSDLLDEHVDLCGVPGAANVGLKGSALVAALLAGASGCEAISEVDRSCSGTGAGDPRLPLSALRWSVLNTKRPREVPNTAGPAG